MKRCTQCIMPDTVPGIELDDNGVCNLCRSYKEPVYQGEAALQEIVDRVKGKGAPYDCIVPLSGGRDSSYVLYKAVETYGLKVLAVNYDNEFRAEQAIRNIRTATSTLGVDLAEIRSKRDIATKIVRGEVRHVLRLGLPAIIQVLCIACAYGYRSVTYRQALKYRVPLIIWGSSQMESTEDVAVRAFDEIQRRAGIEDNRSKLSKLFDFNYVGLRINHALQRWEFRVPGNGVFSDRSVKLHDPGIREISLFDYLPWDREEIKSTIMTHLGWRKPEDHVSTWRTDCMLHEMVNYCYHNPLGCSKACFGYSNMINSGQMTREEALSQEQVVNGRFSDDLRKLLVERVGLSESEVNQIKELQTS